MQLLWENVTTAYALGEVLELSRPRGAYQIVVVTCTC